MQLVDRLGPGPRGAEQAARGGASDDRGGLQHAPGPVGQAIDAREQDLLDGLGHRSRLVQVALLGDDAGQLLEEERVALGPVDDEVGEGRRDVDVEHGPHDALAVLAGQRRQGNLGHVRAIHPRLPIPGAVRHEDEDRQRVDALQQREPERLRRGVDPVQVLDDDDQRPTPAGGSRRADGRRRGSGPGSPREAGVGDRLGLLDAEELEQRGHRFDTAEMRGGRGHGRILVAIRVGGSASSIRNARRSSSRIGRYGMAAP